MKKNLVFIASALAVLAITGCSKKAAAPKANAAVTTKVSDAASLVSKSFVDPITGWAKYDNLIKEIKAETNYETRTKKMHEAEDILMSNYCVIPLYYYNDVYMQKPYVSGIYANAFATKFFMYSKLSNGSKTLRIQLASEPDYLDPALNSSVDGACLAANSFSGLYTYNDKGVTVPACAEKYTVSNDGLTYTVTLKKNLKWSDGSALTAADFEYSWKRAVSPDTAADYEYMFSGFDGYDSGNLNVKALDDTTLQFVLSAPCAYIEDLMAFPTFYPVCKKYVEANSTKEAPGAWCTNAGFVSNGAYVCTSWKHDVSMTYEKNPYWFDADKVTVEKLEFMLSADDTAIFAAYNAGNLEFIDEVANDEIAKLLETKNSEFHIVDELGTYYVAFNAKSKLFEGKTPEQAACMRQALSLIIDRDYIVENIAQTGQVPANAFIPLGMADGNGGVFKSDAVKQGYYDPSAISNDQEGTLAKARELLAAAGFKFDAEGKLSSETPISIEYLTNQTSAHIAIAESIQQDFSSIGIKMTIQVQDWNVFLEERKNGNFDIAREGWIADFNDPINMLEMWISTSGNNDCQFGR